jgi:hypothetical protein
MGLRSRFESICGSATVGRPCKLLIGQSQPSERLQRRVPITTADLHELHLSGRSHQNDKVLARV